LHVVLVKQATGLLKAAQLLATCDAIRLTAPHSILTLATTIDKLLRGGDEVVTPEKPTVKRESFGKRPRQVYERETRPAETGVDTDDEDVIAQPTPAKQSKGSSHPAKRPRDDSGPGTLVALSTVSGQRVEFSSFEKLADFLQVSESHTKRTVRERKPTEDKPWISKEYHVWQVPYLHEDGESIDCSGDEMNELDDTDVRYS
jgi:hypothetical protein